MRKFYYGFGAVCRYECIMSSTALKLITPVAETSRDLPILNLLTRVLIHGFCNIIKSEVLFHDIESTYSEEKFNYWVDAGVKGDFDGQLGLGADTSTLKMLASHLNLLNEEGSPNPEKALITLHESLAVALEKMFAEEDFNCKLGKGSGLLKNHTFYPPEFSYFIFPVETAFGTLKVLFHLKPSSQELMNELLKSEKSFEFRKIRVFASQLENIYQNIREVEGLESRLLSGPHVRAQMRCQIKKMKRMVQQLKSESLETLFSPARKLAMELSKQQGKQIKFITHGTWMFLDKALLNHLYEPVLHLVRNSIDHGMEEPFERERIGKPAEGVLKCLASFNEKGLRLLISDDGKGIQVSQIHEKALLKGLFTQEELERKLPEELYDLVFLPGISSRESADRISGRGLGLDICRKNISLVGGTIKILSSSPQGTAFEIFIPLEEGFSYQLYENTELDKVQTEKDEKTLLVDEASNYLEKLIRVLNNVREEKDISWAYEAYRLIHSIKGACGFLGWSRLASFSHHFEEVLKLISEKKITLDEVMASFLMELGQELSVFFEASKEDKPLSLFSIRKLESRLLQFIWSATQSEDKTHLFFGKYHLEAMQKFLIPATGGETIHFRPEKEFSEALQLPLGALIQFNGDRRGFIGLMLTEDAFKNVFHPLLSSDKGTVSFKEAMAELNEFVTGIGREFSDSTSKRGINLRCSAPLVYSGKGQPMKLLGSPTYCYSAEIKGHKFFLVGDFRLPQEIIELNEHTVNDYYPALLLQQMKKQTSALFNLYGAQVNFNEVATQSDLIGFETGMSTVFTCRSVKKDNPDAVFFLSFDSSLAEHLHSHLRLLDVDTKGNRLDPAEAMTEVSERLARGLVDLLQSKRVELTTEPSTVLLGKAYVANFNRLYLTNKVVGNTQFGKFEIQLLLTELKD